MQQKNNEVVPRTLWEFFDKWLQRLASGDSGSRSTVKIALLIVISFYLVLVAWRIWLVSHALTTFGVDIASVLPVAPGTAALIQKGVTVLLLFSPDALLAYVFFNRDARYWRTVTAISLVAAVGASWWATHEPAVGTHCYVMTPDRGVVFAHVDEQGQCGIDRTSGLQMSPVTRPILTCISAMQRGITPTRLAMSAVNPAAMFDIRSGRSLYWFRRVSDSYFEFYDGPGFDQATATPLEPVTPQNLAHITEYINKRQAAERAAKDNAAAAERATARRAQAREAKVRAARDRAARLEQERLAEAQQRAVEQARAAEEADARAARERQARAVLEREEAEAERQAAIVRAEDERQTRIQQAREDAEERRRAERARVEALHQARVNAAQQRAAQQRAARAQRQVQTGRGRSNGSRRSGSGEGGRNTTYSSKKPPGAPVP